MQHTQGFLDVPHSTGAKSSQLFWQAWRPESAARAAILIVHGLGEHSSRYEHVARYFVDLGFAVYALDHFGHGRSDGQQGYVERFDDYLNGVGALLDSVQRDYPGVPHFLLGHSMGGLIAAAYLLRNQDAFRACVISGPALLTDPMPAKPLLALNRLISAFAPTLPMIALDAAGVSRDPAVVEAYENDPLVCHGKLSARLVAELSATMADTLARAAEIHIPILILHGEKDVLTAPAGSEQMFDNVSSNDKSLTIYPGLFHEIFNEPEQDAVLSDVGNWLEAQF